ncbi:MAG: hypothetical protein HY791_26435 [Deltaproteobacteria bacterium]|nr:hypothetical protein [Deltaproteobacteria bacterium]
MKRIAFGELTRAELLGLVRFTDHRIRPTPWRIIKIVKSIVAEHSSAQGRVLA